MMFRSSFWAVTLTSLLMTSRLCAENPFVEPSSRGATPVRDPLVMTVALLHRAEIRAEIDLLDYQVEPLEILLRKWKTSLPGGGTTHPTRSGATGRWERELEKVLLPHQSERLRQLRLQQLGVHAVLDEFVVRKLRISSDQLREYRAILETIEDDIAHILGGLKSPESVPQVNARLVQCRRSAGQRLQAVLSVEQWQQFNGLLGTPLPRKAETPNRPKSIGEP